MTKPTDEFIEIDNCKLHFLRAGKGRPLLFLHAAGGPPGWPPFLDQLSDHYEVIAPDHPGYGQSETPDWLEDMDDMAYFYLDFIDSLAEKPIHLMGLSLGGWLSQEIAVRSTAGLSTLTLLAPAGHRVEGAPITNVAAEGPEAMIRTLFNDPKMMEHALAELKKEKPPEQLALMARNREGTARMTKKQGLSNPTLAKWLHRIDVPVHILWGEDDKLIPVAHGHEIHRRIPGSKLTILPGTGHQMPVEKPAEMLEAVFAFFKEKGG